MKIENIKLIKDLKNVVAYAWGMEIPDVSKGALACEILSYEVDTSSSSSQPTTT